MNSQIFQQEITSRELKSVKTTPGKRLSMKIIL